MGATESAIGNLGFKYLILQPVANIDNGTLIETQKSQFRQDFFMGMYPMRPTTA